MHELQESKQLLLSVINAVQALSNSVNKHILILNNFIKKSLESKNTKRP